MTPVQLIAVFAENKVGLMARVTKVVADAGINIRWVAIATSETFGVLKLLVDRPDEAFQQLHAAGWTVSRIPVVAVEVPDRPGSLHRVVACLAAAGVNIENASGFVSPNRAVLLIEVADIPAAGTALDAAGLRLLGAADIPTL